MAYDAESDRVILFGGEVAEKGGFKRVNDTWAYDFNTDSWTEMKPSVSPPAQYYPTMTYDAESDRVLMWKGGGDNSMWAYDFNTNTWTDNQTFERPSKGAFGWLAYDSESDRSILYGGGGWEGRNTTDETWAYDYNTNTWTKMEPSEAPGELTIHAMAYNATLDLVVLFGGRVGSGSTYSAETWTYDFNSDTWTNVTFPATAAAIPPTPIPTVETVPMIAVPAGEFTMGSASKIERPPHTVSVDAFEIDQFEVTNEAFEKFVTETSYVTDAEKAGERSWQYYAKDKANHPVVKVSWNDATAFCEWAEKRLPTEVEWEKAARGTNSLTYPWGNDWDVNKVNARESGYGGTMIVGSLPSGASPYGVLDMAGNVAEWTSDWLQPYPEYPGGDSEAQYFGEKYRVIRGGGWFGNQNGVRTTERTASSETMAMPDVGFRCVK